MTRMLELSDQNIKNINVLINVLWPSLIKKRKSVTKARQYNNTWKF